MFVIPADDPERPGEVLIVRDPVNLRSVLPREGGEVPETQYWHQRLLHGDVTLADPPPADDTEDN